MDDAYQTHDDLKNMKVLAKAAPAEFKAWLDLDRIVAREDGTIPRKYRELIAIAVAHTTQCNAAAL
jgi:alkylhydroperoxidase/carboxymuconolactone decarboxylase family protein YurZ